MDDTQNGRPSGLFVLINLFLSIYFFLITTKCVFLLSTTENGYNEWIMKTIISRLEKTTPLGCFHRSLTFYLYLYLWYSFAGQWRASKIRSKLMYKKLKSSSYSEKRKNWKLISAYLFCGKFLFKKCLSRN